MFEASATDPEQSGKPVVVWWFVSGARAYDIIDYYKKKLHRGAHFITFGRWNGTRGGTRLLCVAKTR